MKNLIRSIIITLSLSGPQALASQFQIFLSQPANQTANQTRFASLLEKSIYIDTEAKVIHVPSNSNCPHNAICGEVLRWENFRLTSLQVDRRGLVHATAVQNASKMEITLGINHSTLVTIETAPGMGSAEFVGSPAEPTHFMN
jgi:hypothetical protein